MTLISLIAVVDEQNGLGKNDQLLCYLPADLKHFKAITMGKPIIMGRKTFDAIGKPLPGRTNIVLSKKELTGTVFQGEGVDVAESLPQALALVAQVPEVMIIGGARVYEQALALASRIYLTLIHHRFDADVFFPKLNETDWRCAEKLFRQRDGNNAYDITFYRYERIEDQGSDTKIK